MNSLSQTFEQALAHHRGGDLHQAERLYQQILELAPDNPNALHLLGVIAHQGDKNELAVQYIRRALQSQPEFPEAYNNLGIVLLEQGKSEEAISCHRQALLQKPDYPQAHNNLGNALIRQDNLDAAVSSYRQALALLPDYFEAHFNLGRALARLGEFKESVAVFRQALQLKLDSAETYHNLGISFSMLGKLAEAIAAYRQAILLRPEYAEAFSNLGNVLHRQNKFDEAIANYRLALQLKPEYAEAHFSLGLAMNALGAFDEAAVHLQRALQCNPEYPEAHNNLGNVFKAQGLLDRAADSYRSAIRLQPDYAAAHVNLGNVFYEQGRLDEAVAHFRAAVRLKPDYAGAYLNLANALRDQEEFAEAIENYRLAQRVGHFAAAHNNLAILFRTQGRLADAINGFHAAIALEQNSPMFHDNLILTLQYHPAYDPAALHQEARRWYDRHAEPLSKFHRPHDNDPDPGRRLRIGYVSPDFCHHPLAYELWPLWANHDRRHVEIFAYSNLGASDDMTQQFRDRADCWRLIASMSDEQVAAAVRQDRIDILVDLTLHSANNRLLVFARKPAPIQVTWLGYPGTTGLTAIDYRLTDPYLDPPGADVSSYAEQSMRLPDTFLCYDPCIDPVPIHELPALADGVVTFGCLGNFAKVNDALLGLWARILRAVPRSRLLLLAPRGPARDKVRAVLGEHGLDAARVDFAGRQPRRQYFESYNRIDLAMDTAPYNGHATSLDALWMGVPIVTLVGKTAVGRAGLSLLGNLSLQELAGQTPDEYVAIAVRLAGDLRRLQDLRAGLRQRLRASPLMDGPRFARNMENAYRQMWQKWCDGSRR